MYGTANKREQWYENIRVSRNAWDTNLVKVNPKFMSINLEASGGGQFQIIPLENYGKLPQEYPVYAGHTAAVLDTDFNPFNDCTLSNSELSVIMVFRCGCLLRRRLQSFCLVHSQ